MDEYFAVFLGQLACFFGILWNPVGFSAMEAKKVGYTIAVPQPNKANSTTKAAKWLASASPTKAAPCNNIPHNIKSFLQIKSDRRPLNNCPMPQTAGYTAASRPVSLI